MDGQALDREIERPGTELHLPAGDALDILHDAIAMRFTVGERHHDVEKSRRRWHPGTLRHRVLGTTLLCGYNHGGYMYDGLSDAARADLVRHARWSSANSVMTSTGHRAP